MSNDINEYYYEEHFINSRFDASETHYDRRCKYIRKESCEVYDVERNEVIYDVLILIRLCKCGHFKNKAHRIKYKWRFKLFEIEDGLEAHFHTDCRYSHKKGRRISFYSKELTKLEYCPILEPY